MHRKKHEISPLLPQVGRGSVAPRITLDNWYRVKKYRGYKNCGIKEKKQLSLYLSVEPSQAESNAYTSTIPWDCQRGTPAVHIIIANNFGNQEQCPIQYKLHTACTM